MSETQTPKKSYNFRAKMPLILRGLAVIGFAAAILVIGIGFYNARNNQTFRMKGLPAELSAEVIAVVNGYERRESDNGVVKYFIKADKATTFKDNHQELENVFLQVYDPKNAELSDKISASKAIYVPDTDDSKDFKIFLAGDVDIETRNNLKVKTEQLTYDKKTEVADAEEAVEFERENISGKSFGAIVNIKDRTLDLLKDVEIFAYQTEGGNFLASSDVKTAKIIAGRAFVSQVPEKIKFEQGVEIYLTPQSEINGNLTQATDIKANQATAFFTNKEIDKIDLNGNVDVYQKPNSKNPGWTKTKANSAVATINKELKRLELFDNVLIETTSNDSNPTKISAGNAVYEKDSDVFRLTNNAEIITIEDAKPTRIKAETVLYEQKVGKVFLTGNAEVTQGGDLIKGDLIKAELFPNKKIKYALANGNAFLRQDNSDRKTEVSATEITANFNQNNLIQKANATGKSDVKVIPKNSNEYKQFGIFAPKAINLDFRNDGTLSDLNTQGRTTIKLNASDSSPDSANKNLTADAVNTTLSSNGKELVTAQAKGNAELVIEPLRASSKNYKSVINAAEFNCDFYPGNNAKTCIARSDAKAVRYPTVKSQSKQTLEANLLTASFSQKDQDVEKFDANGKAKFNEADRNGIADRIVYTADDGFVKLRGGEPTVWDSNARAKATEIDWDTINEKSALRGNVSTTYYSQKQTGGATPFQDVNSPVFLTSQNASFDHNAETALYTGNARAWQSNNYVRAEKIFLRQKDEQLYAEGKVQSMLYDAKQTVGGKSSKNPVYATADKMTYQGNLDLIRYENNVDIRQGTDRIVAGVANVFLDKNNEVTKTVITDDVVITQPNRKATGDFAQYTAADESIILRGNPARVSDSESGSSQGREVVVNLRENRVIGKGSDSKNSTGRTRTVYKIKNGKIN
ncbi:MAG: LPS export ABC transporter periplasmic protein LptC [Aridibacter sp.]